MVASRPLTCPSARQRQLTHANFLHCQRQSIAMPPAATPPTATPPPKRKVVYKVDDDVAEVLAATNSAYLTVPIAKAEATKLLDMGTLTALGVGVVASGGVLLFELDEGAAKATARGHIANRLVTLGKLADLCSTEADPTAAAVRMVTRSLHKIEKALRVLDGREAGTPDKKSASLSDRLVVTTASEEERAYSLATYGQPELKVHLDLTKKMYYYDVRPHLVAPMSKLRKVAFAATVEHSWPSPERIPLDAFKTAPTDKPLTLFRRLVTSVCLVAAGMEVPADVRDEGAGKVRGNAKPQWASMEKGQALLNELEEMADSISESTMRGICELLHKQLHKATTVSHTSPSLEMTMLAPRIPEFAHLRVEKRKGDTSPSLKPDKETKSKRQKKREAAAERQKSAGGPPKGDVKEEYRDEDGAKGPNGLPRKKGGNPSGGPCKRYNSKAGCGFNFCSFSHE